MFVLEAEGIQMAKHRNTRNIVYVFSILVFSYNKSNQNFNILLEPSDKEPNVKQPTTHWNFSPSSLQSDKHEGKGEMLFSLKDGWGNPNIEDI